MISDDTAGAAERRRGAHWLRRGLIAWNLPDSRDGFTYRLYWAAEGGLADGGRAITGGSRSR